MVQVTLSFNTERLLEALSVEGHAEAGVQGKDLVCAATTILARTGLRALERAGFTVQASAPERGAFYMQVIPESGAKGLLEGIGFFLEEGFTSLAEDYPASIQVDIR